MYIHRVFFNLCITCKRCRTTNKKCKKKKEIMYKLKNKRPHRALVTHLHVHVCALDIFVSLFSDR